MSRFIAYTHLKNPGLHVWREGTNVKLYLPPLPGAKGPGWVEFDYDFEPAVFEHVRFMLFEFAVEGSPGAFEPDAHQREMPRAAEGTFPETVWFVEGAARIAG